MRIPLILFALLLFVIKTSGQVCNDPICHFVLENGKKEIWHINRPPVNQRVTEFNLVKFKYLDEIWIEAGGCVNTHGLGKTSKRYVNPSGPNSDRLYFGLIKIPGITADLDRVSNYIGKQNILLTPPHIQDEAKLFLTLGYVDDGDNYKDNDYKDQDDGTEDQCKGVGDAWLRITIIHHTKADVPGVPHPKAPLDVWWDEIDDNYLPINPVFGSEYYNGTHPNAITLCDRFPNEGDNTTFGTPPCTTQRPSVDEPSGFASVVCQRDHPAGTVHGHVNWFNVTYTGNVYFEDWQDGFFEDDDIDLYALTSNKNGVLSTNHGDPKLVGLEFKYGETVQWFSTPWWSSFKSNLNDDGNGWRKIRQAIDGKPAIFSGLFGIDNQHDVYTEIHPVHFFAVKLDEQPMTEKWAFFARNWGNEGFCSQDFHGLTVPAYNFFIPNAANIDMANTIIKCNNQSLSFYYRIFEDGIVISLPMPSSQYYGLWHGEISITKRVSGMEKEMKIDSSLITQIFEKEKEGFAHFAEYLTNREMKRWQRKYNKEVNEIESQQADFISKQSSVSYSITPKVNNEIQHPRRTLDLKEEREIPVQSKQMRKPDNLGTIKKDALYMTLNKSILKKSRKQAVFSEKTKHSGHQQQQEQ